MEFKGFDMNIDKTFNAENCAKKPYTEINPNYLEYTDIKYYFRCNFNQSSDYLLENNPDFIISLLQTTKKISLNPKKLI